MKTPCLVTLLYHSVYRTVDSNETYDVRVDAFEEHLRILKERNIRCIALEDLSNPEGDSVESGNRAILTFDDGRRDNHEVVFPMLAEQAVRAVFFVNPARIGKAGYMDWPQLAELDRHGMSVQSHGLTHRYLHLLPPKDLDLELLESKAAIEDRIGTRVEFLSVPGGFYSREVIESAWRQGYRGIFTSDPGVDRIDPPARNTLFHRYNVTRDTSSAEVEDLLSGKHGIRLRRQAMHTVKSGIKRALGTTAYHWIWTNLRKHSR